jgi:hypothetical protein
MKRAVAIAGGLFVLGIGGWFVSGNWNPAPVVNANAVWSSPFPSGSPRPGITPAPKQCLPGQWCPLPFTPVPPTPTPTP